MNTFTLMSHYLLMTSNNTTDIYSYMSRYRKVWCILDWNNDKYKLTLSNFVGKVLKQVLVM